jgi:hypothetical protein
VIAAAIRGKKAGKWLFFEDSCPYDFKDAAPPTILALPNG